MTTKKTVIFMGYGCNNNCIFCCNYDKRTICQQSTEQIKEFIILAKDAGSDYLELIGGEPTIRKDIFEIVSCAKQANFKTIMFATNGRMLMYKPFAEKVIDSGVNHIVFSIHGHNAALHDLLTETPESFEQMLQGIKNLQELDFKNIGSNTCIVNQNFRYLPEIGKEIFSLGIHNSEFIFVDPVNRTGEEFFKIVPRYEDAAPYINRLLTYAQEMKLHNWHIRYFPLCHLYKEHHNKVSEIHEIRTFYTQHIAPDFVDDNVSSNRKNIARTYIAKCKECAYKRLCEGYWKQYLKHYPS